jgi:hypothetical protein
MSAPRPADLVPLADAAAAVGRAPKTLRTWASAGRVGRWREVEGEPGSRVLVSLGEVMLAAAALAEAGPASGPVVAPPPPAGPAAPSSPAVAPVAAAGAPVAGGAAEAELVALRGEVGALRAALAATREVAEARAEAARRVGEALDLALVAERARSAELVATVADLRERLDRAEAAATGARAELGAALAAAGRPWWRRLLAGPVG